jgi:hypothetical protein
MLGRLFRIGNRQTLKLRRSLRTIIIRNVRILSLLRRGNCSRMKACHEVSGSGMWLKIYRLLCWPNYEFAANVFQPK